MAIDLENVSAVVLNPSTSTGPGETTGKGQAVTTNEVRAHAATCIPDAYRSYQVPSDIQAVLTVLGGTQDAHMDSTPDPAKIAANAGLLDTAATKLDSTSAGYRQTLSTFSTVVKDITKVCRR